MTTRISRGALACALLATTSLAAPALAQTNSPPPSAYQNIDDNGVDLTDGSFNFTLVEGTIGAGRGTLALIRYGAGGSSLDNWSGIGLMESTTGGVTTMIVTLANRSESFAPDGAGGFVAKQANGSTLTGGWDSYTWRDADGTQILFGPPGVEENPGQFSGRLVSLSVTQPDGSIASLSWDVYTRCERVLDPSGEPAPCMSFWRLAGVANNHGYAMGIGYQPGGIDANRYPTATWRRRASVTFSNVEAGGPTPTVSYAYPASGVTDITDTGGRVWRIATDASGRITGIRRPGAVSQHHRGLRRQRRRAGDPRRQNHRLQPHRVGLFRHDRGHRRAGAQPHGHVEPEPRTSDPGHRRARAQHLACL